MLIVGAGGLGSPAALYLAAAGVGVIGLADPDTVGLSNLQRQVIYGDADVGRPKVQAAGERLAAANPHVDIHAHSVAVDSDNADGLIAPYDLVLDGTDNFASRFAVNAACSALGKPLVSGAIGRWSGQVGVFLGRPCYRCLVSEIAARRRDLRACRRARRSGRRDRLDDGGGGGEADRRRGRDPGRTAADL